jgi:hypothetical protein
MQMKLTLFAAATALALSGGAALAQSAGGGGGSAGGNPAVGNDTTTSMGAPSGSPSYQAPRSAVVPGLSPQQKMAQQQNQATQPPTDQSATAPVQGPKNPITGRTQTAQ